MRLYSVINTYIATFLLHICLIKENSALKFFKILDYTYSQITLLDYGFSLDNLKRNINYLSNTTIYNYFIIFLNTY